MGFMGNEWLSSTFQRDEWGQKVGQNHRLVGYTTGPRHEAAGAARGRQGWGRGGSTLEQTKQAPAQARPSRV